MTKEATKLEMPAQQEVATPAENNEAASATVAFDPKDEKYLSDYGKAIEMANCSDHEKAIPFIDELLSRYRDMPASEKSYLYYLRGFSLHYSKKDHPEALMYYNLAISSVPDPEGICYYDRGLLNEALGDESERDADFAMFVKLRPDLADWLNESGRPKSNAVSSDTE